MIESAGVRRMYQIGQCQELLQDVLGKSGASEKARVVDLELAIEDITNNTEVIEGMGALIEELRIKMEAY